MRTTASTEPQSRFRKLLVAFVGILLICAVARAQESSRATAMPSMRVHGQATVSVTPDRAQLDMGVVTQAADAEAASDRNAERSKRLIEQLSAIVPTANLKSINVSVNPNYRYPPQGVPIIAGYTASNTVRVLLNDTSKLPTVIAIAIKAGANSINRLTFTLRDETPVRGQALAEAANQAQAGAESLAAALHLKLARLLGVDESQPVIVSPAREITFEKLQSASLTPISPGMIDVHADVDLTYEIAPAAHASRENSRSSRHVP